MGYIVGIDGGGTSCRLAIADGTGRILGQAKSGSANIRTDLAGARANIVAAAEEAAAAAGLPVDAVRSATAVLGLAGGNVGDHAARLQTMLPFGDSHVVSDALIALQGALGSHDGAIAILGTGSIFAARRGEKVRMIGGWGFQIGDLGSGARLGRQLLEEALLAYDGVRASSPLTDAVLQRFEGDPRLMVEAVRDAPPAFYGSFAPQIVGALERGDEVAEAIFADALANAERMLEAVAGNGDERICLLGGLAETYAERMSERFRRRLHAPLGDALQGAVQMAVQIAAAGGKAAR
ncbi:BadF/BadG/BcrA/BcrD ATPase family protein [Jiella sp. M17.18]|uniref:BadF/BadG/BcrA/BcrD ATPase family protein n=1 Tax=Jiella sp. M17.18 TaxID=3234247 RepID=UPI0034E03161